MRLSARDWNRYITKLSLVNEAAAKKMQAFIDANGMEDMDAVVDYAYGLATAYGEAAGELACEMYDAIVEASGKSFPPAEIAPTATYTETSIAVRGTVKNKYNTVPQTVGRLVKQASADTTLQNAKRDRAQFAWVPHGGETCAFCITLASRGWQYISKRAMRNGHAEHIHANCHCEYAISFDKYPHLEGYDPDKYLEMYRNAEGATPAEKIKTLRRELEDNASIKVDLTPKYVYQPGKTIDEVENSLKEIVDSNRFGALGVSLKGIDVDAANEIAKAMTEFFHTYDVEKFGGVIAPAANTKMGKLLSSAVAGYSPIRHSLLLKKADFKTLKTARKALLAEKEAVQKVLKKPERYDFDKFSKRVRNVIEQSKISGRGIVADNITDCINHELGHSLEKKFRNLPNLSTLQDRMPKFAPKISGYATDSWDEYLAESFAAYCKGEDCVDPEMVKAFESMRRK